MCCAEFIVKYVLFGANFIFALAGVALIALGVAVMVQTQEVLDLIPVNLNAIPISVIIAGCIVFAIAFFGCCGAIREARCLLTVYFIIMGLLAAAKIYLATVIFSSLSNIEGTVTDWLNTSFSKDNLRPVFHVLESLFSCCGTTGPEAYTGIQAELPPSCCASASISQVCSSENAFGGCTVRLAGYFGTFGEAIGGLLIAIIVVELTAMLLGMFLCWSVGNKRSTQKLY